MVPATISRSDPECPWPSFGLKLLEFKWGRFPYATQASRHAWKQLVCAVTIVDFSRAFFGWLELDIWVILHIWFDRACCGFAYAFGAWWSLQPTFGLHHQKRAKWIKWNLLERTRLSSYNPKCLLSWNRLGYADTCSEWQVELCASVFSFLSCRTKRVNLGVTCLWRVSSSNCE